MAVAVAVAVAVAAAFVVAVVVVAAARARSIERIKHSRTSKQKKKHHEATSTVRTAWNAGNSCNGFIAPVTL